MKMYEDAEDFIKTNVRYLRGAMFVALLCWPKLPSLFVASQAYIRASRSSSTWLNAFS
jgi:hypothetical protein